MNWCLIISKFKSELQIVFALFLIAGLSWNGYGQNNQGSISGVVKDSLGKPVTHASVGLKGVNKGTYTDKNGSFVLKNVPEGNSTIVIQMMGFGTIEKNVEVKSGMAITLEDLTLNEDVRELDAVDIGIDRNKFAQKESDQIARLPLKNMENPQVYTVVGEKLIKEQVVIERSDIYRNVPGGVPNFSAGGSQGLTLRGFNSTNGMRNGMLTSAVYPLNPVILERIEFLKGPSGTLFGGNRSTTFGGLYNYVIKKPYESFGGEVSFTGGSFQLIRLAADVNTPLNEDKTALFRLNAGYQSEGSFQEQGYGKNYVIAPSFSYQVNDRLKFLVDIDITRSNYTTNSIALGPNALKPNGITARNFKDVTLDYKRSYTNNDVDVENGLNNIGGQIDYKLSNAWKSETKFLYSEGYYKQLLWTTLNLLTDSTVSRVVRNQRPETFGNIELQQNFVGDFKIGSLRNRLLVGLDYNLTYNSLNRATITYDTINFVRSVNIVNKLNSKKAGIADFNGDKIDELSSKAGFSTSTFKSETYSAYVSDVINIRPSLMVMLSLRLDHYNTKGNYTPTTNIYAKNAEFEQTSLSPKLGLVYQPVKEKLSLFANYMNGFVNLAPAAQPNGEVLKLDPQYGTQWEAGIKVDVLKNKLAGSVSYYDITVTNSTYVVGGFTVQDGTQESKGIEVELIASPINGLNIVAGYGNNENKYTKATEALNGKSVMASPENVVNLWASYVIMKGKIKGLGIGAGGNYVSDSWFDPANSFVIPSYTLLSAVIFYDQPRYMLSIKGNNLLDEKYWNSTGMQGKPMNFLGSVALKF